MRKIRLHRTDHQIEKNIVTGMITSTKFLTGIRPIYNPGLMAIPFAKTVAGWCLNYWEQYGEAPGVNIQPIFESHSRNGLDSEQAELIADFLDNLSTEYERSDKLNSEYLLDQAEARFKGRSLETLSEDVLAHLSRGEKADAEALIRDYRQVQRPVSMGINPLTDEDAIREALDEREEDILFKMPGALGKFLGPFERDMLVGVMGMEKAGKSFWLLEFVMRAVRSSCNVAYFIVGDMTQKQVQRRVSSYITGKNRKRREIVSIPVLDCRYNQDDSCRKRDRACDFGVLETNRDETKKLSLEDVPDYKPCTHCVKEEPRAYKGAVWHKAKMIEKLTSDEAVEVGKRFSGRLGGRSIRQIIWPGGVKGVQDIKAQLSMWEDEDFIPDVIVIDYADNLASEDNRKEMRHQINETWMSLRALSMEKHCLIITATQTAATAYEKKKISIKDFSESKQKYGHINMFITLNQTEKERGEGIMRIGTMLPRDDAPGHGVCTVLECRAVSRPYIGSFI